MSETIGVYIQMLQSDFEIYPEFEKLATAICFNNKISAKEWMKGVEAISFEEKIAIPPHFTPEVLRFHDMDVINHEYKYIETKNYNLYSFYTRFMYNSMEELRADDNRYYYLCHNDFVTSLDKLFTDHLVGYSKTGKNIFTKSIQPGISLKINASKKRGHFETMENYYFPNMYLEFNKVKYLISGSPFDVLTFFIMGTFSFTHFFHLNLQLNNREGEPKIYYSDEIDGYVLSNSVENLERFNKFIFLSAELYVHYYKVLEQWAITVFIPKLLEAEKRCF
jgi:hypothetical protein